MKSPAFFIREAGSHGAGFKSPHRSQLMKHFLLLEDDPEDQQFFLDALHSVSETVACYAVENGEEALALLTGLEFRPDIIFTDLNMPKMNGFEFIKAIKNNSALKHIPVIVYSSTYSPESIELVKQLGALAIYSKTRSDKLANILAKYVAGSHLTIL